MKIWFKRNAAPGSVRSSSGGSSGVGALPAPTIIPDDDPSAVETPRALPAPPRNDEPESAQAAKRLRVVDKALPSDAELKGLLTGQNYLSGHKSLYKELLRGMYDAVLVADPKGHVIDSNARVTEMLQYEAGDLWDMPIDEIIRGVSPQVLERIRKNVADQRYVLLDANCRRRDGSSFPAEVAISRLNLLNDGDLVFCVRSIERRRRAQQRLRSQHNAIMNSTMAYAICDTAGTMGFVNAALAEMWAATKTTDLLEQNIRLLWQTPTGIEKAISLALSGDRWIGPLPAVGVQGRTFTVQAMIAPDRDLRNEIIGVVCEFIEVAGT